MFNNKESAEAWNTYSSKVDLMRVCLTDAVAHLKTLVKDNDNAECVLGNIADAEKALKDFEAAFGMADYEAHDAPLA